MGIADTKISPMKLEQPLDTDFDWETRVLLQTIDDCTLPIVCQDTSGVVVNIIS